MANAEDAAKASRSEDDFLIVIMRNSPPGKKLHAESILQNFHCQAKPVRKSKFGHHMAPHREKKPPTKIPRTGVRSAQEIEEVFLILVMG